ncbi:MAG: hypothetical protein K2M87_01460 [Muribaculaceae bacterium]|nr:hypothetical protein [Muribaculaceae bacterium]
MKIISAITIAYMGLASLFGDRPTVATSTESSRLGTETEIETQAERVNDFEKAVELIKKYETLHQARHWPLIGYGHKVLPGEKYTRGKVLSEAEADKLLRRDLLKNCAVFRQFGADSLLLGVLAYNIGSGATLRSAVVQKLKAGNRNIKESYLAHSKYRGKTHKQILNRRIEEFDALFVNEIPSIGKSGHKSSGNPELPAIPAQRTSTGRTETLAANHLPKGGKPTLHTVNSILACTLKSRHSFWL